MLKQIVQILGVIFASTRFATFKRKQNTDVIIQIKFDQIPVNRKCMRNRF